MTLIFKIKQALSSALFPSNPKCGVCGRSLIFERGLFCSNCHQQLRFIGEHACIKCGDILDENMQQYCLRCTETPFLFTSGVSLLVYDDISKRMIWDFKYNHEVDIAYGCGLLLAEKLLKASWFSEIDIVTSVPASKESVEKRGYNQSAIIASAMKEKSDIIINHEIMKKNRDSKDQIGLHIKERQENMKGAFEVIDTELIIGKTVLVIDDVMTTGATMNACSDVLIKAGAAKVYSATVASALLIKT